MMRIILSLLFIVLITQPLFSQEWTGSLDGNWSQSEGWNSEQIPGMQPNADTIRITARENNLKLTLDRELPYQLDGLFVIGRQKDEQIFNAHLNIQPGASLKVNLFSLNEDNGNSDDTSGTVLVHQTGGKVEVTKSLRFGRDPFESVYLLEGGLLKHTGKGGGATISMRSDRENSLSRLKIAGGTFVSSNRLTMGSAKSYVEIESGIFVLDGLLDMGESSRSGDETFLQVKGSKASRIIISRLMARRHPENVSGSSTLQFTLDEKGISPVHVSRISGPTPGDKIVIDLSQYQGKAQEVTLIDYEEFDGMKWAQEDVKFIGGSAELSYSGGDGTSVVIKNIKK